MAGPGPGNPHGIEKVLSSTVGGFLRTTFVVSEILRPMGRARDDDLAPSKQTRIDRYRPGPKKNYGAGNGDHQENANPAQPKPAAAAPTGVRNPSNSEIALAIASKPAIQLLKVPSAAPPR